MRFAVAATSLAALSVSASGVNNLFCDSCKTFVAKAQDVVLSEESAIQSGLENLCRELPRQFADTCSLIVDKQLPKLVNFLTSTPDEFCTNVVELCPAPEVDIMITSLPVKNGLNSLACDTCTAAVDEVAKLVASSATEKDIETALFQLCDNLPVLQLQCRIIISAELPRVLAELSQLTDAKQICSEALNWCPKQQTLLFSLPNNHVPTPEEIQKGVCRKCKDAVNDVQNFVKSHASRADIQAKLDAVCNTFLIDKEECHEIVSEYLARIYDELAIHTQEQVCEEQFPVCTQTAAIVHDAECKACTQVTGKVHDLIQANVNKDTIISIFNGVCNKLPIFKTQCTDFVGIKIPEVISKLENQTDPAVVCEETQLCQSKVAQYLALFL